MKRMSRKFLSILMALVLLVGMIIPSGIMLTAAETEDKIAYVNQGSPAATPEIGNANAPYGSISAAITALDGIAGDNVNRVIKVIGAYSCATAGEALSGTVLAGFATHTNEITIESTTPDDMTALLDMTNVCWAGGPLTFDNIYVKLSNTHWSGADVTFGPGVRNATGDNEEGFYTGVYAIAGADHSVPTETQDIVFDSLNLRNVYLGNSKGDAVFEHPGVNLTVNGGEFYQRIGIGYPNTTIFTGDVNVMVNGGYVGQIRIYDEGNTFQNIQVILNNGINLSDRASDPNFTDLHISGKTGFGDLTNQIYYLKVEENVLGATLTTTETAGTYKVNNSDGIYTAIAYDVNGVEKARSESGYLTVPAAGTYTVKWRAFGEQIAYVDQAEGNNSGAAIGNAEKPYKTISAAIKALDVLKGECSRTIKVIGAYSCATAGETAEDDSAIKGFATHTNHITIESEDLNDSSAVLDLTKLGWAGGPLTFDDIYVTLLNTRLSGADVTFGAGAKSTSVANQSLFSGMYAAGLGSNPSPALTQTQNIVFDGLTIANVQLNDDNTRKPNAYPGVNFTMNGGTLSTGLVIGNTSSLEQGNNFNDDVNVVINNGTIGEVRIDARVSTYQNVQVILNNGVTLSGNGLRVRVPFDVKDDGYITNMTAMLSQLSLYYIQVAAHPQNDVKLTATETAGVYKIVGDLDGLIPVVKDGKGNTVTNAYDGKDTITVSAVGLYTVSFAGSDRTVHHFDFTSNLDKSFMTDSSDSCYVETNKQPGQVPWFYDVTFQTSDASNTEGYVLSFDYYMPEQTSIFVCDARSMSYLPDVTTHSAYLQQGYHSYSYQYKGEVFGLAGDYDATTDMLDGVRDGKYNEFSLLPGEVYIWNLKIVDNAGYTVDYTLDTTGFEGYGKNCYEQVNRDINEWTKLDDEVSVYEIDFTKNPTFKLDNNGDPVLDASGEKIRDYKDYVVYFPPKRTISAKTESNAENEYTISFDYFLPENAAKTTVYFGNFANADGGRGLRNIAAGENNDYTLEAGCHTFKAVITRDMFTQNDATLPSLCFEINYGVGSELLKLYIWNVQFYCSTEGAADTRYGNLVQNKPLVTSPENQTKVTLRSVPVSDLTSVVELEMDSVQYRSDHSLRFVAAIKGASIARDAQSGEADYNDGATITIGGKTYTVTAAGVLFARDVRLGGAPEEVLRLGDDNNNAIINIPALKLQSSEHHERYLGTDKNGVVNQGVVYTGVIKGIPRANWEESLSARAYVTIIDLDGNEVTIYGNVISRSLMQVKPSTELSSNFTDDQADEMLNNILGAGNTAIPENYTALYYVDSEGGNDDTGDGSIDSPWKTLANVQADALNDDGSKDAPVVVLFKRGGEYRGQLRTQDYTIYGAYGEIEDGKPIINGSQMNYATEVPEYDSVEKAQTAGGLGWVKLDEKYGNRWQLVGSGDYWTSLNNDAEVGNNVGNIYFFDNDGTMLAYGSKSMDASIYQDYEFYHHYDVRDIAGEGETDAGRVTALELGDLFVYLPDGMTPTKSFGKIEIATKMSIITGTSDTMTDVTIDNLCVKYTGGHGISFSSTDGPAHSNNNISITNCEIGWIGGSIMRYTKDTVDYSDDMDVRLGNGIEFFGACDTITVENNWIYQCYDAGYSNQGSAQVAQNINVTNNLIEYCAYSIEIWMNAEYGLMKNCHYDNNMMRFAGYEFERDNRIGGSLDAVSHVCFMDGAMPCEGVTVNGNTFDTSYVSMLVMGHPNPLATEKNTANDGASTLVQAGVDAGNDLIGPVVSGNTWIQGYDLHSRLAYLWRDTGNMYLSATSQDEMTQHIGDIDSNPVKAIFHK